MERDPEMETDRRSTAPAPRWVKVFGAVALVVVLLIVALMLAGGGGHGPGRHTGGGARTPASGAMEAPEAADRVLPDDSH